MKSKYLFLLFFLYFSNYLSFVEPLEIIISDEVSNTDNGTSNISNLNLTNILNNDSLKNSDLSIVMPNETPYIIDIIVKVTNNLYIRGSCQSRTLPQIAFKNNGFFELNGNFTIIFEKIRFIMRNFFGESALLIQSAFELKLNACELLTSSMINTTFLSLYRVNSAQLLRCNLSLLLFEHSKFISIIESNMMSIEECYFSNITIKNDVFIVSSQTAFHLLNSFFINNSILKSGNQKKISIIRVVSASFTLASTLFKFNVIDNSPILLIENELDKNRIMNIISNVIFELNFQVNDADLALNLIGNISKLLMDNVLFYNNFATNSIFHISNSFDIIIINNLTIINNFGNSLMKLELIRNISILSLRCINNNKDNENLRTDNKLNSNFGNCLTLIDYSFINLKNCIFSSNFADSTLTGVYLEHTSEFDILNQINPQNLQAFFEGMECTNNRVDISIKKSIISGNCIYLNNLGTVTIINGNFASNIISDRRSGNPCLISNSKNNILHIYNSLFKQNQAYSECSCLNFYGKHLTITNSSFIENRSIKMEYSGSKSFSIDSEGGCLNIGAENITIKDLFIFNSSAMKGAGIFFHNRFSKKFQFLQASNMTIMRNDGIQTSGMEFDATLLYGNYYFSNCSFKENKVEFFGVISSFYYTKFNIFFIFNDISYNWGISAGAAFSFCHFDGNIYLNQTIFIGNVLNQTPIVGGAALFVYGINVKTLIFIKNCTFIENFSSLKGGAIQVSFGQVYIKASIFIDNYAFIGGALSVTIFSYGSLQNSIIKNKFLVNQGGGVHIQDFAILNIFDTAFIDCEAKKGGGIYASGIKMNIFYENISFYNVKADDGAAFWIKNVNSKTILLNINIDNSKTFFSSIFYLELSNVTAFNIFLNKNEGRAFSLINVTINILNIQIINHFCNNSNYLGCIMLSQQCAIELNDLLLDNINSLFVEDTFSISNSKFQISNITFNNVRSNFSKTLFMNALNSLVFIKNSLFLDLNNSLIDALFCSIEILNCVFFNISSKTNYGIIKIMSSFSFIISNTTFSFINGKLGGVVTILNNNERSYCSLYSVFFKNCHAEHGAALYLYNQNINISNCLFENCLAKFNGGAILFDCLEEKKCKWLIYDSHFFNNSASQGGAYHSNNYLPENDRYCVFFNNSAIYGPNFSAFPVKLSLTVEEKIIDCDIEPSFCYLRENITSGQRIHPIIISVLDAYNQKMTQVKSVGFVDFSIIDDNCFDDYSESKAPQRENILIEGVNIQKIANGTFNFSEIGIISQPLSNVWLIIKADCIKKYYSDFFPNNSHFHRKNINTNSYYFALKIFLRDCIPGEIYSNNKTKCIPCPKGKYSFKKTDKICKACPRATDCEGRTGFKIKSGYWRNSNLSDEIYPCLQITESCLGGESSSCLNGYTGVICGACEFNHNKKFFKKALFYCEECQHVWIYILTTVGIIFLIFVLILFLIASKKGSNLENFVLVKIMMNHVQTVSFLANIKIELPYFLVGFSGIQAPLCSFDSIAFTIECFKDITKMSNFEMKVNFSLIFSSSLILFLIFFYVLYGILKKQTKNDIYENLFNALVVVGSFFQPTFINFYIQNVSCDEFGSDSYLTFNLEQKCWDRSHKIYAMSIIFPALFFWMFIFPLIFLSYMILNKNNLKNPKVLKITKFFQAGYKENCFFWEFIQMSRKFLVILFSTFLRNNPQSVLYIIVAIISFYFILQIVFMPFRTNLNFNFNLLEILSLNACFFSFYLVIFLKNYNQNHKIGILTLIIGFNLLFFLAWVKNYLVFLKGKIIAFIKSILSHRQRQKNKSKNIKKIEFIVSTRIIT